jgi:hypothetical protein
MGTGSFKLLSDKDLNRFQAANKRRRKTLQQLLLLSNSKMKPFWNNQLD